MATASVDAQQDARRYGHERDRQEFRYTKSSFEAAKTRDPDWNAATNEQKAGGFLLDGRDPGSYASVARLFGLHDRPRGQRPIFGTVGYMSAGSLERTCDVDAYVAVVRQRAAAALDGTE